MIGPQESGPASTPAPLCAGFRSQGLMTTLLPPSAFEARHQRPDVALSRTNARRDPPGHPSESKP